MPRGRPGGVCKTALKDPGVCYTREPLLVLFQSPAYRKDVSVAPQSSPSGPLDRDEAVCSGRARVW